MHPCGHSSVKFLWSCDARALDSFPLFKSTQCFQNMFFYQFVHSSESILGVRENFHSIHPLSVYTFFFQKLVMIGERKVGSYLFSQAYCFLVRQPFFYFYLFSFFLLFLTCSLFLSLFFSFLSYLSLVHFLSLFFFFHFFSLKRSCGRGCTLPTYV